MSTKHKNQSQSMRTISKIMSATMAVSSVVALSPVIASAEGEVVSPVSTDVGKIITTTSVSPSPEPTATPGPTTLSESINAASVVVSPLGDLNLASTTNSIPVTSSQSVSFNDNDPHAGLIDGTVNIKPAFDESSISGYKLYWADPNNKYGEADGSMVDSASKPPIYFIHKDGTVTDYVYNLIEHMIPNGATKLAVVPIDLSGEPVGSSEKYVDLVDDSSNTNTPTFTTDAINYSITPGYSGKLYYIVVPSEISVTHNDVLTGHYEYDGPVLAPIHSSIDVASRHQVTIALDNSSLVADKDYNLYSVIVPTGVTDITYAPIIKLSVHLSQQISYAYTTTNDTITIGFNESITVSGIVGHPFTITGVASSPHVSEVSTSDNQIDLTLDHSIAAGEIIKINYSPDLENYIDSSVPINFTFIEVSNGVSNFFRRTPVMDLAATRKAGETLAAGDTIVTFEPSLSGATQLHIEFPYAAEDIPLLAPLASAALFRENPNSTMLSEGLTQEDFHLLDVTDPTSPSSTPISNIHVYNFSGPSITFDLGSALLAGHTYKLSVLNPNKITMPINAIANAQAFIQTVHYTNPGFSQVLDIYGFHGIKIIAADGNFAPTASGVGFSGSMRVGQTLTGYYTYKDAEDNAESVTGSVYRWYRAPEASSILKEEIGSGLNYTITPEDQGMYVSFEVTPIASSDTMDGIASSSLSAFVAAPDANAFALTNTAAVANATNHIYATATVTKSTGHAGNEFVVFQLMDNHDNQVALESQMFDMTKG